MLELPTRVRKIVNDLHEAGGRCFLVGGFVRDLELNIESKDIDIEIHGLELPEVEKVLSKSGEVDLVGKAFGVYKMKGLDVDWSLPRKEISIGDKHKDFSVTVDPYLGIEEALRRRDFTINAMAVDMSNFTKIDPFRGDIDIHERRLRYVDDKTFIEDPLRVLRGAQFCARFDLWPCEQTIELCRSMSPMYGFLPKERIWEELKKMLLKGIKPSLGIEFLRSVDWLKYWPEINTLFSVEQDKEHHPEGDVGIHTCQVVDVAATLKEDLPEEERLPYMLACLLHDVGKATTTEFRKGRITAYGHDRAGVDIARHFLRRLTNEESLVDQVAPLVGNHMFPQYCMPAGPTAYRRLQKKVDPYLLGKVAEADGMKPHCEEKYYRMLKKVGLVSNKRTIVQGRDLIAKGMTPGVEFGKIIEECEEIFLETGIRDPEELLRIHALRAEFNQLM